MLSGRLASGDVPPSSNNIAIRKRKRDICDLIHNMTWVVESFVILSGCTIQRLSLKIGPYLVQSIQDTNGLLCARIIVPFTYLYDIKQIILEHGWIRATKAALTFDRFLEILPFQKTIQPLFTHLKYLLKVLPILKMFSFRDLGCTQ